MTLEPGDTTSSSTPINPYTMQQQRIPPKDVVLETQKFVRNNPGTYEDLHRNVKTEIAPMAFEGIRATFSRALSQSFQTTHSFNIHNAQTSKYTFATTYLGDKEVRANELTPLLMAEMDSQSNLNFQAFHNFSKHLRGRAVLQTQKDVWTTTQLDMTYFGDKFTSQNTLVNGDLKNGSGIFVSSYLHRLHPNFDVGSELFYQRAPGGSQQIALASFCARLRGGTNIFAKPSSLGISYPSPKWTATINAGLAGWHLSYHRNCSEHLQLGVDYEYNRSTGSSDVSLVYSVDIPKNGFNFKGCINSNAVVSGVTEIRMQQFPFSILFSAGVNYKTHDTSVGIGVNLG